MWCSRIYGLNDHVSLQDYLTQTYSRPPRDASKNLKLYNATEKDGMTTLIYYRKRDTGDTAGDIVITVSWLIGGGGGGNSSSSSTG